MPSESPPILRMAPDRPFRILQITDFHNDGEAALVEQTYHAVRSMCADWKPDLLAVTGDIWCSDNAPELASVRMQRDLNFLGSLGIPWGFCWGNHDYMGAFEAHQAAIDAAPNILYTASDGKGNARIELHAPGDAAPAWDVFFLNSGQWWVLPEALAWFREESARLRAARGRVVPAIAYFHIPLKNYQTAMESGRAQGIALEEVLCWGDEEGEAERIFKEAGNVRACFCGHSHRNDFRFEEDGIVFAYGRCTGHGGYGDDVPKGATLLELDPFSGSFLFFTVFPGGATWTP